MNYRRRLLPLLALLPLCLVAFSKKNPQATVRFHTEANPQDTEQFSTRVTLSNSGKEIYIQKIPFISERDVLAIYPFPGDDGTMGCAFKLNGHGTLELETQSTMRRGTLVLAYINARLITEMEMDRRVTDGVLMIPRGITPEEIASLKKRYPTLGQSKRKSKEP